MENSRSKDKVKNDGATVPVNIDIYTVERIRQLNSLIGQETLTPAELRRAISTAEDLAHRLRRFIPRDPELVEKRVAALREYRTKQKTQEAAG